VKRSLDRQHNEQTEINVSPLIDMVFILLIFFIVATSFVNEIGISSSYKDSSSARDIDTPPLLFDLPGSGQVFLNGSPVGLEGVAPQVRNALTPAPPSVIVRVSAGAKAGFATQVMDQALLAGANAVKLVTDNQ
jgi:biopolymer transport protein ExbD